MPDFIIGNKVKIRKAIPEDSNILCKWYADGRVMIHVGFADGLNENADTLRRRLSNQVSESALFIVINEHGFPIGECNYNDLDKEKCNIGIKICELTYQGLGYGEDTLQTFINYLFVNHNLKHIDLDTLVENTRAQNLYKKIGFREINIDKDCWVDKAGKNRSAVKMILTKEDFYS